MDVLFRKLYLTLQLRRSHLSCSSDTLLSSRSFSTLVLRLSSMALSLSFLSLSSSSLASSRSSLTLWMSALAWCFSSLNLSSSSFSWSLSWMSRGKAWRHTHRWRNQGVAKCTDGWIIIPLLIHVSHLYPSVHFVLFLPKLFPPTLQICCLMRDRNH